jgi:hypothetical protein
MYLLIECGKIKEKRDIGLHLPMQSSIHLITYLENPARPLI